MPNIKIPTFAKQVLVSIFFLACPFCQKEKTISYIFIKYWSQIFLKQNTKVETIKGLSDLTTENTQVMRDKIKKNIFKIEGK